MATRTAWAQVSQSIPNVLISTRSNSALAEVENTTLIAAATNSTRIDIISV